jgi:5'-nucleotidase / UDP-sugar diphosphatase
LFFGKIVVAIPTYTKGALTLVPKNKAGQPLQEKTELLADPRGDTPDLLPPPGTVDKTSVDTVTKGGVVREIKEWEAIMDYIRSLPVKNKDGLPMLPVDERASEVRAIKVG